MSRQPGIYSDIGKNATDVLYGDYIRHPPVHYHYNLFDWSFYLNCQGGIVPGLNTLLKFYIPYQRSNKVEMQYLHDYFGITTGISLTKSPLLSLSGVTGIGLFCVGTDISYDTATATLTKCNAGFSFNSDILTTSLTLSDKADTLRALCYRKIQPLTRTAIAAELTHKFISRQTTLTLGAQHSLFPFMLIKARVTSDGSVGALVQNDIFSTFFLTIAAQMNVMNATNTAKLGFALALKH